MIMSLHHVLKEQSSKKLITARKDCIKSNTLRHVMLLMGGKLLCPASPNFAMALSADSGWPLGFPFYYYYRPGSISLTTSELYSPFCLSSLVFSSLLFSPFIVPSLPLILSSLLLFLFSSRVSFGLLFSFLLFSSRAASSRLGLAQV